jgi:hypothetical protein
MWGMDKGPVRGRSSIPDLITSLRNSTNTILAVKQVVLYKELTARCKGWLRALFVNSRQDNLNANELSNQH